MLRILFGRISLHGLGSLISSSQITAFNLIARPSKDIVVTWELQTGIPLLPNPQGNAQAEAVNKVMVNGLKKRLDDSKGRWVEELPHVLWKYRTTPRWSTRETPFSMTYGVEAVIPLETSFPMLRTSTFTRSNNDELLGKSLDLIEERREKAMIQLAYYH